MASVETPGKGKGALSRTRALLKKGAVLASQAIPMRSLVRFAKTPPLVVYYHVISDADLPHVKHLYSYKSCREFEADLDFLLKTFAPVTLEQLILSVQSRKALPPTSIFLTFDDGLREAFDVAFPVLKRKGIPAAFFVSSAFLDNKDLFFRFKASLLIEKARRSERVPDERHVRQLFEKSGIPFIDFRSSVLQLNYGQRRLLDEIAGLYEVDFVEFLARERPYMDSEQVKRLLAEGFHIGGHGIDHPLFRLLAMDEQVRQTEESMRFLKERFQQIRGIFSFPFSAEGISDEYFALVKDMNLVDLFFGTGGFGMDFEKRLLNRVPFDGTTHHAIKRRYLDAGLRLKRR